MKFSNRGSFLNRWPLFGLAASLMILAVAVAGMSTGADPAGAEDGSQTPARPAGLKISTQQGSLDVSVDWDDVANATSYLVRWREAGPGNPLNEGVRPDVFGHGHHGGRLRRLGGAGGSLQRRQLR